MKSTIFPLIPLVTAVLALTGCQGSALFFGTETKTGLTVSAKDGNPNASLSYQRGELAIIPKSSTGKTHAVFGGLDHDYSMGGHGFMIAQTFATGQAAINASNGAEGTDSGSNQDGTVYFATGTTFGLDLSTRDATTQTPGVLLGFRRAEAVFIPTKADANQTNSVYADISIVHAPTDSGLPKDEATLKLANRSVADMPLTKNGIRIRQKFATGDAAIRFVKNEEVLRKLTTAASNHVAAAELVASTAKVTKTLISASDYAATLARVPESDPKRSEILAQARRTLEGEITILPDTYKELVNLTVPNLQPAPLGRLQAALKGILP